MTLTEKDRKKIFRHPFFAEMDPHTAEALFSVHGCYVCDYADGETILSPEKKTRAMGLLLSGEAEVTTKDATRHSLLRKLSEGEVFGVSNLFTEEPFATRITAEKKCRVFFLPRESVLAILSSDAAFLARYLEFLCNRVCFLNRKIGYLTAGSAERRLALYLSSYEESEILFDSSLSALSDLLDVGRASLYRAFDRLIADGYIQKDGRRITILNPEAMLKAYQ